VIVIGGGPAGLTAAIYASRMGMKTILFDRKTLGGRALDAPIIENYPGFPDGTTGPELMERIVKQAQKFGTELRSSEEVLDLSVASEVKAVATRTGTYYSPGLIVASGVQRRKLLVPGEADLLGMGVSYCVMCDGALFEGKQTAVVGCDDEAFTDALYLSDFAKKVTIVTQREEIDAAKDLTERCRQKGNVEILNASVKSIIGDNYVKSIMVHDLRSSTDLEIPVEGVFISIGGVPMTNLMQKAGIMVDERGCIKVDSRQATNIDGVFAAGDCTCGGMQIATSVGEGAMAGMSAWKYVRKIKK